MMDDDENDDEGAVAEVKKKGGERWRSRNYIENGRQGKPGLTTTRQEAK